MDVDDFDDLARCLINLIVALVILILGLGRILASSPLSSCVPIGADHSLKHLVAFVCSVNKLTADSFRLFLVFFNDGATHHRGLFRVV